MELYESGENGIEEARSRSLEIEGRGLTDFRVTIRMSALVDPPRLEVGRSAVGGCGEVRRG